MREHAVDFFRTKLFTRFAAFDDTCGTQRFNILITHIGQCGFAVCAECFFHILNQMIDQMQIVFMDVEYFFGRFITFHQFGCCKPHRITCVVGMIFDDMSDCVDCTVYLTGTEIKMHRAEIVLHNIGHGFDQVMNALVFSG